MPIPHRIPRRVASLMLSLSAALLLNATPASAHEGHLKPMYGGVTADAQLFQVELVFKGKEATLHVTEHGAPVESTGATGKLTVQSGNAKEEVALTPNGYQSLGGKLKSKPARGAKASASITIPSKGTGEVSFSVK